MLFIYNHIEEFLVNSKFKIPFHFKYENVSIIF